MMKRAKSLPGVGPGGLGGGGAGAGSVGAGVTTGAGVRTGGNVGLGVGCSEGRPVRSKVGDFVG